MQTMYKKQTWKKLQKSSSLKKNYLNFFVIHFLWTVNGLIAVLYHRYASLQYTYLVNKLFCWKLLKSNQIQNINSQLSHLLNSTLHGLSIQPDEPVLADVEVNEVKAGSHFVIVGQLLDQVRPEAQPEDRLGDEGVVEPLQLVVRDVEPLEVVLAHQQAVDVFQLVVVQTESLKRHYG